MNKTLFAALAGAALLAVPLAASAGSGYNGQQGDGHHGGRGQAGAVARPQGAGPAGRGDFRGQGANRGVGAAPQFRGQGGARNFGASPQFRGGNVNRGWNGQQGFRGSDRRDDRGYARGGYGYRDGRADYGRYYGGGYGRSSRWIVGGFLPGSYWNSYADPYVYGLEEAPWGYHWVVVDGEALLIEDGTGAIVQAVPI